MGPLSLAAEPMVRLTGVVPSVSRTMALVAQPLGAVFACTRKRVAVTALSSAANYSLTRKITTGTVLRAPEMRKPSKSSTSA